MIKNIIILILFVLLALTVTDVITHKQVIDLGTKTKDLGVDLIKTNKDFLSQEEKGKLETLGYQNLTIIKNYTFDSIQGLLKTKEGKEKLKKVFLHDILEKYKLDDLNQLKQNTTAYQEYLNGLRQID